MPVVVDVGGGQRYQRLPWAGEVWEDFQGEWADCLPGFGRLEKTCQGERGRQEIHCPCQSFGECHGLWAYLRLIFFFLSRPAEDTIAVHMSTREGLGLMKTVIKLEWVFSVNNREFSPKNLDNLLLCQQVILTVLGPHSGLAKFPIRRGLPSPQAVASSTSYLSLCSAGHWGGNHWPNHSLLASLLDFPLPGLGSSFWIHHLLA